MTPGVELARWRSSRVTDSRMELVIDCVVFVPSQRIPRDRRHLRGRCQPRRAAGDGSGTGRRCFSCEAKTLQGPRHLPNDSAAPELVDDWPSNVAEVSTTSSAKTSQGSS